MKKIISVVLIAALVMSMFTVCGFAANSADSIGYDIGQMLGSIVFAPFLLIDEIIWIITGVHIFYPQFG